jgi:hypothetical protein
LNVPRRRRLRWSLRAVLKAKRLFRSVLAPALPSSPRAIQSTVAPIDASLPLDQGSCIVGALVPVAPAVPFPAAGPARPATPATVEPASWVGCVPT